MTGVSRPSDAIAVLDQVGAQRAVVIAWCGAGAELLLAAEHPDRVAGLVMIAPDLQLTPEPAEAEGSYSFDDELETPDRLGEMEPALLAARLAGLPGLLLPRDIY